MNRASPIEFLKQKRLLLSFSPQKSYSQFGEDIQILRMVGSEIGTYWDIGSGHPVIGNNTFALYKLGWHGILVEPISELAKSSEVMRPRDIVVNRVVGEEANDFNFYRFKPYQYSTVLESQAKASMARGLKLIEVKSIQSISIRTIAELHEVSPKVISIDTEGFDEVILKSILDLRIFPACFCVEDFTPDIRDSNIHIQLSDLGYSLVARIFPSSVYFRPYSREK